MPVINTIQTNFTRGVLSPLTRGLVDATAWNRGAKEINNGIPLKSGGVLRRNGLRKVAEAGDSNRLVILIPYVFSESQAYILEFGHEYIRVYHDNEPVLYGGDPYQIASPYTEAHLVDLEWHHQGDTLFLLHKEVPPHRLQRFANDLWRIEQIVFNPAPYAEIGHRLNAALTLSSASVGTGVTVNATSSVFLESDVGRYLISGAGRALVTAFVDSGEVTVTIEADFVGTSIDPLLGRLLGSPQGALTISDAPADVNIGAEVELTSSTYNPDGEKVISHLSGVDGGGGTTTLVTATCIAHGYSTSDVVNISGYDIIGLPSPPVNGSFTITVVDADHFTYTLTGLYEFDEPDNGTCQRTSGTGAALDLFRAEDVGSFVLINSGLVRITRFDDAKKAVGILHRMHTSDIAARPNAWILSQAAWNAQDGYPRTGTTYKQRLVLAGSTSYPHTVWGSATGEAHNFELWVNDDDAFSFTLSSDEINPIRHLASHRALLVFTEGAVFSVQGGVEKPISPTNANVTEQANYGANGVKPTRVGNEILYCQRGGTRVRAVAYRFETDSFAAPDMSWIADHLLPDGVVSVAYQQEPHTVLWCVTAEGSLVSLTLDRDSDTVAWAEHSTDGEVESVACIPDGAVDALWAVVRRTVNRVPIRFIERMSPEVATDCAIASSGAASLTWACPHLENKEVDVIGDGMYHGRFVVDDGYVTLAHPAESVEIGLHFDTRVVTLTPQIEAPSTPHGAALRTSEVTLRFHETVGATVNGREIPFREFGEADLDDPIPLFTGDVHLEKLGWTKGVDELTIEQPVPLPWHLLAVIRKLQWND